MYVASFKLVCLYSEMSLSHRVKAQIRDSVELRIKIMP
jgi:hypothetical protein